jgi:membrane protein implicated in regulation of membrane protease activity
VRTFAIGTGIGLGFLLFVSPRTSFSAVFGLAILLIGLAILLIGLAILLIGLAILDFLSIIATAQERQAKAQEEIARHLDYAADVLQDFVDDKEEAESNASATGQS